MAAQSEAELKLLHHLYEKILAREVATFANLIEYVSKLKHPGKIDKVIHKSFQLIKELHWGFFKDLNRANYTKLWKELVLPYGDFKEGGDLKRNISISNIFVAMLDIHGYTKFCQESKGNLSRLRKLDEFLHNGIIKIAGHNRALATRERGDEIIIIASSGKLIRTKAKSISIIGRATQGVRLINLAEKDKVVSVARVVEKDEENGQSGDLFKEE